MLSQNDKYNRYKVNRTASMSVSFVLEVTDTDAPHSVFESLTKKLQIITF